MLAALERGTLPDWRRLIAAIDEDPWGRVAHIVEQAFRLQLPYGVGPLFTAALADARKRAAAAERGAVAEEVRQLIERSGLSQAEFAAHIGTSASRLSTYASGKLTPSAGFLVRKRKVLTAAGVAISNI